MSCLHATALSGSSGYMLLTGHSLQNCDRTVFLVSAISLISVQRPAISI